MRRSYFKQKLSNFDKIYNNRSQKADFFTQIDIGCHKIDIVL